MLFSLQSSLFPFTIKSMKKEKLGMMKKKWWKESVGYQIYPRSFFDSNNDGVGDLRGIIQKMDYIEKLGVNLVWICPFYRSPMDDNGYDVSDFYDVDPLFGNIEDAKTLIEESHKRNIKIILDLVMNQTSDEHPWFIESKKNKTNDKRDWYIWRDGKVDKNNRLQPPNNWASFFEGSCWKYDETTNQYFMKIFSDKMPDLNWENKQLRDAMKNMAKWWLDLGVDGFRIDAIAHLAKDTSFEDSSFPLDRSGYAQDWHKFSSRDRLFDYLEEFHDDVLKKYDCVSVGEVGGGASMEEVTRYAGYDKKGFDMVFNFDHCWFKPSMADEGNTEGDLPVDVVGLKQNFTKWINNSYNKTWIPHYWLNHDHPRVMSQYGDPIHYFKPSGKMLGMILLTLPGTPFIYNGEEIGMTNVDYNSLDDFQDVWAKNYISDARNRISEAQILRHLSRSSRDNARTPMQWNEKINAGFTLGTPHQKVVGNYQSINVAQQQKDPKSILNMYQKMVDFRLHSEYSECLIYGDYTLEYELHPTLFVYSRKLDGVHLRILANFSNQEISFDELLLQTNLLVNNYDTLKSNKLLPYQTLIVKAS
jgi:oligo-1,6-glucosidase